MATTKKAATKRPTKKSTSASTAKKTPAKKTAKKTPTRSAASSSPKRVPLREREPKVLLEDAGYAVTGVIGDVVDLAKALPDRVKTLRSEGPTRFETQWTELRERLVKDGDRFITSFEKVFDGKAAEGRKLAEQVKQDERISTLLERTTTSRSQVKAAVTSATKTADVAIEAGKKQLDVARSQAKGAATAASKAPQKARAAAKPQAENAKTKAKAAVTSTKRTAEAVADEVAEATS